MPETTRVLSQAQIDEYALLSTDDNPLHVDPEFAARSAFGRTIAHGTIPCAVLLDLAETAAELTFPIVAEFKFTAPAFPGERLDFEVSAGAHERALDCRAASHGTPVVIGTVTYGE